MPYAFIDDGFTIPAKIAATEFHPEISIVYRPMVSAEARRASLKISEAGGAKVTEASIATSEKVMCELIAKRLDSWTVRDRGGHEVEITADNVARLEQTLQAKLFELVIGNAAPRWEQESAKN